MLRAAILFAGLLAAARAQDVDLLGVCASNKMPNADPKGLKSVPRFSGEMEVLIEQTIINKKTVTDMHLDYSKSADKLHMTSKSKQNSSELWVNAARNLFLGVGISSDPDAGCQYQALDVNFNAQFLGFTYNEAGQIALGTPKDVLHFTTSNDGNHTYVGTGSVRGIPTEMWQVCQTSVQTSSHSNSVVFHFLAKSITSTPWGGQSLMAAIINTSSVTSPNFESLRYDYVNMVYLLDADSNHLLPPPKTYCAGESAATNLPKMPDTFSFKSEVLNYADADEIGALPTLTYQHQEYIRSLGMYSKISLSQPASNNYADYKLTVHDFNAMISYTVDMIAGSCMATTLMLNNLDDIADTKGNIRLRTPQEFFHLNIDYQYIGIRKHESRGIDCDVWVNFSTDNLGNPLMLTWFFASRQWKTAAGFRVDEDIPVSLEIDQKGAKRIYNIYEYSVKPFNIRPDYSVCFGSDQVTVVMGLSGGTYQQTYVGYASDFTTSFVLALIENGQFSMATRIINIDVQPGQGSNIIVRFTILGNPIHVENLNGVQLLNASAIYQSLQENFQSNGISFQITDDGGASHGTLSVTSMRILNGKPNRIPPTPRLHAGSGSGSGYTSGDMAGIALGLLMVGLIVGFAAVFLIHRVRKSRVGYDMSVKLQNIQEQ